MVRLQAEVLGGFSVTVGERSVGPADWQRVSAERLVKLLLVTPGHALSREAAGEQLWPEADPDHQAANVRKALHFARRALDPGPGSRPVLAADRDRLALDDSVELDLDLDRLTEAIREADRSREAPGPEVVDAAIQTILALGDRELLPADPYEEWLTGLRERLAWRWREVAMRVARADGAGGNPARAQAVVERVLLRDPADEDAHRLAIEIFGAQGRHHAARRQFFQCRRELAALGVEPSPETVAALGLAEAAGLADRRRVAAEAAPSIVGRQAELTRLEAVLDRIVEGRHASLVVQGPAGIGKSRLLEEVATYARSSGWQVLETRAVESAPGLSFALVGAALGGALRREAVESWAEPAASAAATLVPGLGLEPGIAFKHPRALAAAVIELIRLLATTAPVVLLIDDGQWLDPGSAELLLALAGGTRDVPLLLSVGVRTHEPDSRPAEALIDGLRRLGAEVLEPTPLRRRDIPALVARHLGGTGVEGTLADLLLDQSGGNPLFCLELARDARDRGAVALVSEQWHMTRPLDSSRVPQGVARLVRARCRRLNRATVEILTLAAEAGDFVEYRLLTAASDAPADAVLGALDEALEAGLLREVAAGYRFAHPLFRAALAGDVRRPRRAALLFSLARALAGDVDPTDPQAVEAVLASRTDPLGVAERALAAYDDGIKEAAGLAVAFGLAAGMLQAARFDREGARATLERSLAAWRRMTPADQPRYQASPAFRTLGEVLVTLGRDQDATEAFREAIRTARGSEEAGEAYHALAWVPYRHGDYEATLAILDEGIARAKEDELLRGLLMMESGWLKFRHQRLHESLAQLQEADRTISARGSETLRMQVLDCLWGPLESLGRGDETLGYLQEALALAIRFGEAAWEQRIRAHLGFRLVRAGTPGQARPHLDRAVRLGSMAGDAYMEAVATWAAAEMEYALGNDVGAAGLRRRELALLQGTGGNPRHEALAHAHLALIHRRLGEVEADLLEQRLARESAHHPSVQDPEFVGRLESYLAADSWVSMSQ